MAGNELALLEVKSLVDFFLSLLDLYFILFALSRLRIFWLLVGVGVFLLVGVVVVFFVGGVFPFLLNLVVFLVLNGVEVLNVGLRVLLLFSQADVVDGWSTL